METHEHNFELYKKTSHVRSRPGDSHSEFVKRTLAAQMHAAAAVLSLIGLIVLLRLAGGATLDRFGSIAVFGVSALFLFSVSAVQHFLDDGFHISKKLLILLENMDKFGVYLLIAGTYTAVVVHTLSGSAAHWLLLIVWVLAIVGCIYTVYIELLPQWAQSRFFYTGQFVLLGWLALLQIGPMCSRLTTLQILLFVSGGGFYTIGAVAYALKRPNPYQYFGYHEIWHLFVMFGCLMFFLMIGSFYF